MRKLEQEIRRIVGYVVASSGGGNPADLTSVKSIVEANSAQLTSVANAVSAATAAAGTATSVANGANSVANAASAAVAVVSADVTSVKASHTSLVSDVGRISTNHTSLVSDVGRVSTNVASISANVTSVAARLDTVSANHTSLVSDVSRVSNLVSAVSAAVTSVNNRISAISTNVTSVTNLLSVMSAGLGGMQMKVVAGTQTLSAATKISGLSLSVAANGIYQVEGMIIHAMSVVSSFGFGISTSAATFVNAAYRWIGNLSVVSTGTGISGITNTFTGIGYGNESAFGAYTYSALAGTATTNMQTELRGVIAISTAGGTLQLKAKGGTGNDLLIKAGSYVRAYKIG